MNIFFKSLSIICLCMLSLNSSAQEMKITGTVYDSTGTRPVNNAMAMAVRMKDSLLLGFTRTDSEGKFTLKGFEIDTFSLIIDHPNFDEKTYYMFGNKDNLEINIPSVIMPNKSQEIEEVVIYAYKDPIYYKGDTLVYVADSFKVDENAVVEDLLKKLPGISVDKDGKITSQGQEIGKVLVDGDEFFGSDPTIATKNLGADGVETVQIYEKENDEGIGDDEKIQVLDLKLKEDAKKGYFGRISGATDFALTPIDGEIGTNPFYEGELLLNKFNGSQKISVFALGSNTPRSGFGWGDARKFGLDNETSGNRWDGGNTTNTSGIPETLKAGVYYSDKFGKKKQTEVGFNYSYYNDKLDAVSASESQYFLSDTTYFTDDSTRNYTANESHRINVNFQTKFDSLTTFQIKPRVSIDKGLTDNSDISNFFSGDNIPSLSTEIYNKNDSKGYSVGGFARLNRKFMKKKREMELRYDIDMEDNETDGSLYSRSRLVSSALVIDSADQSKINDNSTMNHYGTFTYIEPIAKKMKLEFEYLYQYGYSIQDKKTFDSDGTNYSLLRADLSNEFDNTRQQHRAGLKYIFEPKKHRFELGLKVRNIDIVNVNKITTAVVNQNITNLLPSFEYRFRPSMSKRFNVTYRTSSSQPSINDLQPVPDNSNPNRLKEGNPDLRPNYNHMVNLMFNTWNAMSGRYVWAGSFINITDDAFANATSFDQYGRMISKTINVDGNINSAVYAGAGLPFFGRKIEVNPRFDGSFNRYTNYISGERNVTDNWSVKPALNVKFTWDSLEIGLKSSYAYNNPISSLSSASSTPFTIQEYGADFEWRLPLGFTIGADGTYTKNSQEGDGFYDTEFFVLNAEVSKKFLKTQNLTVALVGNDILNQNINARRVVNGNIVTDYRTTIISRYFLMRVTLRFNNRRTKEEDHNGWH